MQFGEDAYLQKTFSHFDRVSYERFNDQYFTNADSTSALSWASQEKCSMHKMPINHEAVRNL